MKAARIVGYGTAAALLLYVFSVGPAYRWYARSFASYLDIGRPEHPAAVERMEARGNIYRTVYEPLLWCGDAWWPAGWVLDEYLFLWEPDPEKGRR